MKRLILMRHAKSRWKDPALKDFDRPLNKRGRENALLMGRRIAQRGFKPQMILASPALRARQTAELVLPELGASVEKILFESALYQNDAAILLERVKKIEDGYEQVLLIGHNPELTALAQELAHQEIADIVTGGLVGLRFPAASWALIQPGSGTLFFQDFPKNCGIATPEGKFFQRRP